jgi:curved DNA-binding protein CbpA
MFFDILLSRQSETPRWGSEGELVVSTAMGTLYDLLGALPDDDAEGLRTAFRKAAKATHPDLNPDNPEAALRFRQLVRAHEILSDEQQRAAYDQLLAIATRPPPSKSKPVYEKLRTFASSTIAATIISGVLVAGYALLGNVSPAPATAEIRIRTTAPELADVAAAAGAVSPSENAGSVWIASADTTASFAISDRKPYRERDIFEDRGGDRDSALTGFDLLLRGDPRFAAAYLDRAILFYRTHKFSHAFADMNRAKHVAPPKAAPKPARTLVSTRKTQPKDHPVLVPVPVRQERMIAAITP